MNIKDKVVIVTGASSGMGLETAKLLSEKGAKVALVARSKDKLDKLSIKLKNSFVVPTDMTVEKDIKKMIESVLEHYGRIDILVNNAGVSKAAMLWKMTEEQWDDVVDIHLKGAFLCTQAVSNHMRDRKCGKIINVISTAGVYGTAGQINYASAKAGLIGFTKSASRELGRAGITVNAVQIGVIETEMTETIRTDPKLKDLYMGRIQLGRFGTVDDVSPIFVFLGSDEANWITAQIIGVDGGYVG